MPYRPISRGELPRKESIRQRCGGGGKVQAKRCGWRLLRLFAAMEILQTCPLAIVESASIVDQKEGRTCQPRIHGAVLPQVEHQGKLCRSGIFSILERLVLQLAARIVLQNRLRCVNEGRFSVACGGVASTRGVRCKVHLQLILDRRFQAPALHAARV